MDIRPPEDWVPHGAQHPVSSVRFQPAASKADIRDFAKRLFGQSHVVLWIAEDPLGEYLHAHVWHGLTIYKIQADLGYGSGDLFASRSKLSRLFRNYERRASAQ